MTYKEILEACWTGYRQAGMKNKGGRQVPNCVPVGEAELEENLRDWFKEKWVRFGPDGKIRGDCARGSEKEGKPKCLPQAKAHAARKVVRQQRPENGVKIPTPTVQERPSTWPLKRNDHRRTI